MPFWGPLVAFLGSIRGFWVTTLLLLAAMEGLGFLDALNSAPIPGIKIKKKKKVLSPTAAKVRRSLPGYRHRLPSLSKRPSPNNKRPLLSAPQPSPFEGKPAPETSSAKPSSPEPTASSEPMETDRPGTPVPAVEVPEPMETCKLG